TISPLHHRPLPRPPHLPYTTLFRSPAIAKAMLAQHKFRTYYYGNFEGTAPKPGEPDTRRWEAFTHQPRIGQNYVGFRNRLTILRSEEHTSELQSRVDLVCRLLLEKK